ncbi:MAG: flagellar hook-length control protein FliK [Clostridiales bacterium]|nr:flagellar hook-length control protein FliK [Clostridiales bacterium]
MQVNKSVNASNFLAVGNQTSKGNLAKSEKNVQTDFASCLSLAENDTSLSVSEKQVQTSEKVSSSTQSKKNDEAVGQNTVRQDSIKQKETDKTVVAEGNETTEENIKLSENEENSNIVVETDEDAFVDKLDTLLEVFGNILQQVMEQFGLTEEALGEKLNEFEMEKMDLLSEEGLKTFFLSMKSVEVSDLIVDEKLNSEWNQFLNDVAKIVETAGFSLEELSAMPEQMELKDIFEELSLVDEKTPNVLEKVNPKLQQKEVNFTGIKDEIEVVLSDERMVQSMSDSSEFNMNEEQQNTFNADKEFKFESESTSVEKQESHFQNPILQAIEDAVDNVNQISFTEEAAVSGKEVVEQIVEQIKVNMSQQTTSLEMQLYPEHLGKIQIHVVSKDGVMTAKIVAESEAAKQAIEGGLANLKEAMEHQDLKVEAIEVMVATTGFEQQTDEQNSYEQKQGSRSGKKLNLSELEEDDTIEESAERERMKYSGSSVSYTA